MDRPDEIIFVLKLATHHFDAVFPSGSPRQYAVVDSPEDAAIVLWLR